MRINRYIASCGITSRRKADELIREGNVSVNGQKITEPGLEVDETKDIVEVSGVVITLGEEKVYYALHKPIGYISAVSDNRGRKTVVELIDTPHRLYPVGRLDYMSEGLLLLTNDGEFTNRMIHPRYHIEKTYLVCVSGKEPKNIKDLFQRGIRIDGYKTKPADIVLLDRKGEILTYRITLFEGRNRQIRKMFQSLNMKVLSLKRISIGKLQIGDLKEGSYRRLTEQELAYFKTRLK